MAFINGQYLIPLLLFLNSLFQYLRDRGSFASSNSRNITIISSRNITIINKTNISSANDIGNWHGRGSTNSNKQIDIE